MAYFPFHVLADEVAQDGPTATERAYSDDPVERAEQKAVEQFVENNPGVEYVVTKTRRFGHVTIVVSEK